MARIRSIELIVIHLLQADDTIDKRTCADPLANVAQATLAEPRRGVPSGVRTQRRLAETHMAALYEALNMFHETP